MRIADKMNYEQVKSNLSKNRSDLSDIQNQASTQKRVNKPSDDPLAASRVLQARTDISAGSQFLKSVSQARSFLEQSDGAIAELVEVVNRAKELAISQSNDPSANPNSRAVSAAEIDQLHDQSIQIANRKSGDRFIFGGFKTTKPPFDHNGRYFGDEGEITVSIQKEGAVAMNMPGNRIFLGQRVKAPAEAGPEPTQRFDQPDDRVSLRGPASIVDVIPLIAGKDDERLDPNRNVPSYSPEGVNIFSTLKDLSTGLRTNDKVTVQESLDKLDDALSQVILTRSQLGARVSTLNSAMESLSKGQVDSKVLQSNLEDVDAFELVTDLNKSESTLKAALTTSSKLIQPSLLDFLR